MESDLDRSLHLLESTLAPFQSPLRPPLPLHQRTAPTQNIFQQPLHHYHLFEGLHDEEDYDNETCNNSLLSNISITGSVLRNQSEALRSTANALHMEFFEIQQGTPELRSVMKLCSEFAQSCHDGLKMMGELQSKVKDGGERARRWLEVEWSTWQLLHILYQDRFGCLETRGDGDQYFGFSEKRCMLELFKRETLIRECQLVIDWLEYIANDREDHVLQLPDNTDGWENTLHQLVSADTIVFPSTRQTITEMDPDAPFHQQLSLHDLDAEDERKLLRKVFRMIRCGRLDDAVEACTNAGHGWRAGILQGWRLFHDTGVAGEEEGETRVVEGNVHRDLWKKMALKFCANTELSAYERASVAAYCGDLSSLLLVCGDWEDWLWAHLKVLVDIRVESELRDCVKKNYTELPASYWEQRMSLNEVFKKLRASRNREVQEEAGDPKRLIQEYIILEEIKELVEKLSGWLDESWVDAQFLRFAAHLVLFLEEIGQVVNREHFERIIESYLKVLVEMKETRLVAFFAGKLKRQKRVLLYSSYLESVTNNEDRREALLFAEGSNMDVFEIAKKTVENIRNKPDDITLALQQTTTESDLKKISSIDWLLFYDLHRLEAMTQTNALIRSFLTQRKLEAAKLAFAKIPPTSIELILSIGELSQKADFTIKQYLCYKAYLDAYEAFNVWFTQFSHKPREIDPLPEGVAFTEKVAYEHRVSKYKAELERWRLTCGDLGKIAKGKLYNVLLFPDGGWLTGVDEALRGVCLPEIIVLLYKVLYESKLYGECVQLADVLASEKYKLYKVYSKEKLGEILVKICEASAALLSEKKDPFGNDI